MSGAAPARAGPAAPPEVEAYLAALAARVREVLGDRLVGVYAIGSVSLGAYRPGRSDVDAAAVADGPLDGPTKRTLAAALRHDALPCPARGLELAAYDRAVLAAPRWPLPFELNLNTGRGMAERLDLALGHEPAHWYLIDMAIAREHGRALLGPPAREVIGPVPRALVVEALLSSLRWHAGHEADESNLRGNAARGWHWLEEGAWVSKEAGLAWAAERVGDDAAIVPAARAALEAAA